MGFVALVRYDACRVQVAEDSPSGPGQMQRLLHACEQHGLASSSTVICRAAGASAWYQGRVGAAAAWMLRARDERRLAAVLEPVVSELREVLRSGVGSYKVSNCPCDHGLHCPCAWAPVYPSYPHCKVPC